MRRGLAVFLEDNIVPTTEPPTLIKTPCYHLSHDNFPRLFHTHPKLFFFGGGGALFQKLTRILNYVAAYIALECSAQLEGREVCL